VGYVFAAIDRAANVIRDGDRANLVVVLREPHSSAGCRRIIPVNNCRAAFESRRPRFLFASNRIQASDRPGCGALLVRDPANEVDERNDRIDVADAFGVRALSFGWLLPFFPVRNDNLGPRKGSPYAAQQKIQLGRRNGADRDKRNDIRMLVGRRFRGGTDPGHCSDRMLSGS
jgi:hypothetical protein